VALATAGHTGRADDALAAARAAVSADAELLGAVADVLPLLGPAGVPALATDLFGADPATRAFAAWALGRLGPAAELAAAALRRACDDADGRVALQALGALARFAPAAVWLPAVTAQVRPPAGPDAGLRSVLLALGSPVIPAVQAAWVAAGGPDDGPLTDLLAALCALDESDGGEVPAVERRRQEFRARWAAELPRLRSVPPAEPDRDLLAAAAGRERLEIVLNRLLLDMLRPPPRAKGSAGA